MSEDVFQQYRKYYDLLYRDKDYAREVGYVVQRLRDCSPVAREILEFGSGTGRHGRLLAEQGFAVFGVERSETMAASAKRVAGGSRPDNPGSFDCVQGDVRRVNMGRTFDAVLSLFHVVSYQTSNEDLLLTFNNAACHLRPGGVFLFDVWHGPAVLTERPDVRVKRVEDDATVLTRIAEPELDTQAGVVTVRYTMMGESKSGGKLVRFGEEHHMRYLFPTEIDLLARQTGFKVERSEEFLTGAKPSVNTWGVAYLLRKL
jgi:SAM-dependent methyltransferase